MSWIESHTVLARHPKTIRLAKSLHVSIPQAIGHLHLLWWWALDYAPHGDLGDFEADELATAALYEDDPDRFVAALRAAHFLDADNRLHDWDDYAGRLLQKRAGDAERKRIERAQSSLIEEHPADDQRTSGGRPHDGAGTVPYRTLPDRTGPDITGPDRTEPERETRARAPADSLTEAFLETLALEFAVQLGGLDAARDAIVAACNHTAIDKAKDPALYLRRWLRRDADHYATEPRNGTTRQRSPGSLHPTPTTSPAGSRRGSGVGIIIPDDAERARLDALAYRPERDLG